ncbi:MAG: hypothetical protein IK088_04410, partial [Lachnospiraceae bacterium]|nr:hypothetical protein [Lachnospiraceae bacterium]
EWDPTIFIGGTEPGAEVRFNNGEKAGTIHYNMIFSDPKQLETLLEEFPEYEFTGGPEGHFIYPAFTQKRLGELIDAVKRLGGFFVFPHPRSMSYGTNKYGGNFEDWALRDEIGIEVPYVDIESGQTVRNYELWTSLLNAGHRMWVTAGGDLHSCAHWYALTSIYAEEKTSACIIKHLRDGDLTAGAVGIQMCMGETRMGGKCDFEGKRLVVAVGKFHKSVRNPEHKYRMDIRDGKDLVYSEEISCVSPTYFAMEAKDVRLYRVEIFDTTRNLCVAYGNPIWNEKYLGVKDEING